MRNVYYSGQSRTDKHKLHRKIFPKIVKLSKEGFCVRTVPPRFDPTLAQSVLYIVNMAKTNSFKSKIYSTAIEGSGR